MQCVSGCASTLKGEKDGDDARMDYMRRSISTAADKELLGSIEWKPSMRAQTLVGRNSKFALVTSDTTMSAFLGCVFGRAQHVIVFGASK